MLPACIPNHLRTIRRVAAAFTWAAERARAGDGPTLIEGIAMRVRPRLSRRHAVSRKDQPPSCIPAPRLGYANKEPLTNTGQARSDPDVRAAARGGRRDQRRRARQDQDVGGRDGRSSGAARDQRAVAAARASRRRRVQGRSAAHADRSARPVDPSRAVNSGADAATRAGTAVRSQGQHLARSGDDGRWRRAACRSPPTRNVGGQHATRSR